MKKYIKLFLLLIILNSCNHDSYENEDLVIRYLKDNKSIFSKNENDFYILISKAIKMTCVSQHFAYEPDAMITEISDSLPNKIVYIISDDNYINIGARMFFNNRENLVFINTSTEKMEKYGFRKDPMLFHIINNEIIEWKYLIESN